MRFLAQGTWVQGFIDDWIARWCTAQRTSLQNWYLRFIAWSGQLVLYCRIFPHVQDDEESRDTLKADIIKLASKILTAAYENSTVLHTLNHSISIPFATLVLLKMTESHREVMLKCALRFAGDPSRPGARLPTFSNFNSDQTMAIML